PARMSAGQLEAGYRRAYRDFYRWGSILRAASAKESVAARARHLAYAVGWKKCEPLWDIIVRAKRVGNFSGALEALLASFSALHRRPVSEVTHVAGAAPPCGRRPVTTGAPTALL
ncbi:MAG: hypothetical protein JSV65_02160, partial [Armatimonadota bacterium]